MKCDYFISRFCIRQLMFALIVSSLVIALGLTATRLDASPQPQTASSSKDITERSFELPAVNGTLSVLVAEPKQATKSQAVIVVQDDMNVDRFDDYARKFASEGFVAVVPDFKKRAAAKPLSGLAPLGTLADLRAVCEYVMKQPNVNPNRVSIVGFGWGGWRAWMVGEQIPDIYKIVIFDGVTPTEGLDRIHASVLANYGRFDFRNAENAIWAKEQMDAGGKMFLYFVYPDANPGFVYQGSSSYNDTAAQLAWKRTLEFLMAP